MMKLNEDKRMQTQLRKTPEEYAVWTLKTPWRWRWLMS